MLMSTVLPQAEAKKKCLPLASIVAALLIFSVFLFKKIDFWGEINQNNEITINAES